MNGAAVDHLVVAAGTLEQGVAWCAAKFGVAPAAGGVHPLMGTHNRLLRLGGRFDRCYLEIIAIDPQAAPPARRRWFDLDAPALQATVRQEPRLVHFVARCGDAAGALAAWRAQGLEAGTLVGAQRQTPAGLLQWQISLRGDGRRLLAGALPTLIEWAGCHPTDQLPASGVMLHGLTAHHPQPARLQAAYDALGLEGVAIAAGGPDLVAKLSAPAGAVELHSWGM